MYVIHYLMVKIFFKFVCKLVFNSNVLLNENKQYNGDSKI